MEIIGYLGAILMGVSLGFFGGGGSILTVPILVYLFNIDPVLATAYSLSIVGVTSLVGSFSHMRMGNIDFRTTLVFGIRAIISVYLTRRMLLPAIPENLFTIGNLEVNKSLGLLLLFAIIMLLASWSMIRPSRNSNNVPVQKNGYNYPLILTEGTVVGVVTGLVGAGGGFLIIPALVLLGGLEMKKAVGTSLFMIATKSLIGFTGDLSGKLIIDWHFLIMFSAIAIVGIVVGSVLSKSVSNEKLKPAFGWFVLAMGIYILLKETLMAL